PVARAWRGRREQPMRRGIVASVTTWVIVATLGVGIAQPQQPPTPQRPILPPGTVAPPPEVPKEKQIEGTVSKVDASAKTIEVSTGFFGLFGATVRVGDATQIRVLGQPATLTEIRKGDRLKASYEVRAGNNIAKSIDVMPAPKKQAATIRPWGTTS